MIAASLGAGALGLVVGYDIRRFAAPSPVSAAYIGLSIATLDAVCFAFVGADGVTWASIGQALGVALSYLIRRELQKGDGDDAL